MLWIQVIYESQRRKLTFRSSAWSLPVWFGPRANQRWTPSRPDEHHDQQHDARSGIHPQTENRCLTVVRRRGSRKLYRELHVISRVVSHSDALSVLTRYDQLQHCVIKRLRVIRHDSWPFIFMLLSVVRTPTHLLNHGGTYIR